MNRSIRYSKISTLSQLRNERARLKSDITNKELLLNLQYREITEYFSIANMISLFVSRLNSLTPLFSWVQSAFNFIRSLFGNNDVDDAVDVDDTIEKPSATKQKRGRPKKDTTQPVKKSVNKEDQSKTEQPDEKQSAKKSLVQTPTVKRSTKKPANNKSS